MYYGLAADLTRKYTCAKLCSSRLKTLRLVAQAAVFTAQMPMKADICKRRERLGKQRRLMKKRNACEANPASAEMTTHSHDSVKRKRMYAVAMKLERPVASSIGVISSKAMKRK